MLTNTDVKMKTPMYSGNLNVIHKKNVTKVIDIVIRIVVN
ncbi:hypothetical protein EMIT019CA3_10920 [Bacillus pseudomycoides]